MEDKIIRLFIRRMTGDSRLNVYHISLMLGMYAIGGKIGEPFRITRKTAMEKGHMHSIANYHKCIRELTDLGYINYIPSYHPGIRTEVTLLPDSYKMLA